MCHNSDMQSAQIEKCMAHGMPEKIVKTIEYTMRKRAGEHIRKTTEMCEPLDVPMLSDEELDQQNDREHNCCYEEQNVKSLSNASSCSCACKAKANTNQPTNTNNKTIYEGRSATMATASTIKFATDAVAAVAATTEVLSPVIFPNSEILKCPFTGTTKLFQATQLNGRFRQLKDQTDELITNLGGDINLSKSNSISVDSNANGTSEATSTEAEVYVDVLAVSTQLTKQFMERLSQVVTKFQTSKICTLFTRTTQPAHFIAICILSFVLLTVGPELLESTTLPTASSSKPANDQNVATTVKTDARQQHTILVVIVYLGAFATHFGAQIWMTFVSGLSLYFSLPRHTFGQCQQILFPKYFALNSMLSIGMLILFVKYFLSHWSMAACMQLAALALTAVIEVTVRLYLAPPMLRLMHEKYRIEDAIGSGREVGSLVQGDLVQCPHYQRIHKAFRRIHMTIAIGNMAVLLATFLHLYFLASKIQIT